LTSLAASAGEGSAFPTLSAASLAGDTNPMVQVKLDKLLVRTALETSVADGLRKGSRMQ